jgi:hypothetical protein
MQNDIAVRATIACDNQGGAETFKWGFRASCLIAALFFATQCIKIHFNWHHEMEKKVNEKKLENQVENHSKLTSRKLNSCVIEINKGPCPLSCGRKIAYLDRPKASSLLQATSHWEPCVQIDSALWTRVIGSNHLVLVVATTSCCNDD